MTKKLTAYSFALFFIVLQTQAQDSTDWRKGILKDEFVFEQASFPYAHSSSIAETPEGLVAVWYGGTDEGEKDVFIYSSMLTEAGWTEPTVAAEGIDGSSRYATWNPVLYQYPGGDLLLFYKVGPSPSTWWGVLKRSKDHGKTWGEAEKLPNGIIGPVKNKPILLDDGTLLCGSSTENKGWTVHFEMTSDTAKTWTSTSPINDGSKFPSIQPTILSHADGRLQMLCRTKTGIIGESWSNDGGKNWSLIAGGTLPQNGTGFDGVTLADGRQLLVYNHVVPPAGQYKGVRNPLNIALSNDGVTWYASAILAEKELKDDEWYTYPSVIQSADGFVHIVYTWRRTHIRYVKVDPAQLNMTQVVNEEWIRETVDVTSVAVSSKTGNQTIEEEKGTLELIATVSPGNASNQEVTWESDNPQIATVSQQGVVTAVSEGKTLIRAVSQDNNISGSIQITVAYPVITSLSNLKDTSVYPNPIHDKLTVEFGSGQPQKCEIIMSDVLGAEIYREAVEKSKSHSIDMTHFKPGIYFLNVNVSDESRTFRLVKE